MAQILLFEDSPSLRRIVTRYLRDAGHDVSAFADGRASRDPAVLERADVVVTDLSMPEIDGRRVLHNVGTLRADLPAILMTGVERFADPVLDTAYGYLQKPFPENDLLEMIDAALKDTGGERDRIESGIESRFAKISDMTPARHDAEEMARMSFCGDLPPASEPGRFARIRAMVGRWLPWRDGDGS